MQNHKDSRCPFDGDVTYSTEKEYLLSEAHPRPSLQTWGWGWGDFAGMEPCTLHTQLTTPQVFLHISLASWLQAPQKWEEKEVSLESKEFIMLLPDTLFLLHFIVAVTEKKRGSCSTKYERK